MKKVRLVQPSEEHPRNTEGSVIELADGRLLLVYTKFYATPADRWRPESIDDPRPDRRMSRMAGRDNGPAFLAGRLSCDGGETWSEDAEIIPNEGRINVMSVSLLRLADGRLLLGYLVKNQSRVDQYYCVRHSEDEGRTWGKRIYLTSSADTWPGARGYGICNDRLLQLSGGRLLAPAHFHTEPCRRIRVFLSDDLGESWRVGPPVPHAGGEPAAPIEGLSEPGVVECSDGRVLLYVRTGCGCHYTSLSDDGGETWSPLDPSRDLITPASPALIKRVPATGEWLAVTNDHSGRFPWPEGTNKRLPLVASLSNDDGATWTRHLELEPYGDNPDAACSYPSICFSAQRPDRVVLSYYAGNMQLGYTGGKALLQITLLSLDEIRAAERSTT